MRIVESQVGDIRRKVFTEVARLAYEGGDFSRIDALPYKIIPGEIATYRDSIFLERAIVGERLRLAIGLPLRPIGEHASTSEGIEKSAINTKYFDPPLVNIIKFACNACPTKYEVSDQCQNCLAHPCVEVCPTGAVYMAGNRSNITQDKCIKCGRCKEACPYNAIIFLERPCSKACGVDAIGDDQYGRAEIDQDVCVSCGMCIVNCPFGAITDKAQIFQLVHAIKNDEKVIAIMAPSYVGQFGPKVTPEKLVAALKAVGFDSVHEVAVGADLCSIQEAEDFLREVPEEIPFMGTSCCPSWSAMAKKQFPELAGCISMALTPMVLTARLIKRDCPDCRIVFIGPCAAKKLEASRRSVRSNVDFVLTFEELMGIFEAKEIDLAGITPDAEGFKGATAAGRGFPVGGGVAQAVIDVIGRIDPEREVKTASAMGLRDCRALLKDAAAGKYNGYLLEGMGCPGGCVGGTGTLQNARKSAALVGKSVKETELKNALESEYEVTLDMLIAPQE